MRQAGRCLDEHKESCIGSALSFLWVAERMCHRRTSSHRWDNLILPSCIRDNHSAWKTDPVAFRWSGDTLSAPWKQQTPKINQKYQFHSAFRLTSIYLALRSGLPAIAMNKACLFTILQGKLQALLTSNCTRKDKAEA